LFKRKKRNSILGCMLIMMFLISMVAPAINPGNAYASETTTLEEAMGEIVSYYLNNKTSLDSWEEVIGLTNSGIDLSNDPWQLPDWDVESLDTESSSGVNYSSTILGMASVGQDPTDINGRNLVSELASMQSDSGSFSGSINNTIWSIIALDTTGGNYEVAEAVNYLATQQTDDGGFALSGDSADPDITGVALLALATHTDVEGATEVIDQAKESLRSMQLDSGGFSSGVENTESIASVIRGLTAIGEDITSSGWTKNEKTMIDALFALQLEDYSFSHKIGGNTDDMATRQALIAVSDLVNGNVFYNIAHGETGGSSDEEQVRVRVRVEGATSSLSNSEATVSGTALDALNEAVGPDNVVAPGGYVTEILGESGATDIADGIDTSWYYYVIRDGNIEQGAFSVGPGSYNVEDGDEVVFYIGAHDKTYAGKTYFPVINVNPASPTAGQTVTINITALEYDWTSGLQALSANEETAIGDFTVKVGEQEYTSGYGQVTLADVSQGTLEYSIINGNDAGYPDVVTYIGSINVGAAANSTVRVRVEGATASLSDSEATVSGTALDALMAAVGADNVVAPGGYVTEILGESGETDIADGIDTSWYYYVIRDGNIEQGAFSVGSGSYNVEDGDEVVFYIGAHDKAYAGKTYFPVINVNPASPTAGQTVTINITAQEYDWTSGLQALSADEETAIGDYTVRIGEQEYTSSYGQVTLANVSRGTLEYSIINGNDAGYPDVVTYIGSIYIRNTGGSSDDSNDNIKVYIAVVGSDGELLYSPRWVTVDPDDPYGLTAVGALDATGLSWSYSSGLVNEIEGQSNESMNGWMCKINEDPLSISAFESEVEQDDEVIWWYSYDPYSNGPDMDDLRSGSISVPTTAVMSALSQSIEDIISLYSEQLEELQDQTLIINADKRMTAKDINALQNKLDMNMVSLEQQVGPEKIVIGDEMQEISVLIPENAVSGTATITIEEVSDEHILQQFALRIGSSIYRFGPDGSKFNKPLTICIQISITGDMNIGRLSPAWYDIEKHQWIPIPAIIDLETGLVIFRIDHFTAFAVVELPIRSISFSDVSNDIDWAREAIEVLAGQGIIKGTGTGFEPGRPISRAEFVQLMVKALNLSGTSSSDMGFSDVQPGDWFAAAVETGYANDIISGYPDGTFKPHKPISRNEIASILKRLSQSDLSGIELCYADQHDIPTWALAGLRFTYEAKLMNGYEDGTFRGHNSLTRAEAAVTVYRYLNYLVATGYEL